MDPSFYFQAASNPNFLPKMPKPGNQPIQNLKPGYSYPENQLFYSQPTRPDPQMELFRAAQNYNYPEAHSKPEGYPNTAKVYKNPKGNMVIIDVWRQNLEEEFNRIMDLIEDFPLIALVPYSFLPDLLLVRTPNSLASRTATTQ